MHAYIFILFQYYRTNEKHSVYIFIRCHLQRLISLYTLENAYNVLIAPFQVKCHLGVLLHAAPCHCTVLLNDDNTCVNWFIYFISCDPVSSNQMKIIYIGIM